MKLKTVSIFCLLIVFVFVCGGMFSGCRRSEVLEQKIYTENEEIDWQNETKEKENEEENINEDQEITSKQEMEDAETERNQIDTKAVEGTGNSGSTPKLQYGENAPSMGTTEASGQGTVQGNDAMGVGVTETAEDIPADSGEVQVVEEDGETITIPDSYSKVSAVGSAAVFVEILGGTHRLKASSESFTGSSLSHSLFSDLGEVQTLWTGDGNTAISDENLNHLISLLNADSTGKGACLYDSGTLSGSQVQILENAGIDTYVISLAQNSSEAYKEQVTAIGQILGDDAAGKAKEYCNWHDHVVSMASSGATDTKNTLYVSAWDGNAYWQVADKTGSGLAIAPSKTLVTLFDEYLGAAGVENRIKKVAGEMGVPRSWYVNPLLGNGVYPVNLYGTLAETLKDEFSNKLTSDYYNGFYLGNDVFPAVIAADSTVAQNLRNDKESGEGLWSDYGEQDVVGGTGYGMVIGDSLVPSTIHGAYDIFTLPRGITGNWASGTPEGVLASMWAASKFGGTVTMDDVTSQLKYFYENFCGTSPGEEQLAGLLTG